MEEWTGILRLDAEVRNGKTVARNVYFQGAYKVMRPIYHDESGQACYYILNPGGGFLDGDSYRMQISLDNNAQMTLTTQSATKIYKTPKSFAYQETEINLKEGSYFEYIPDPIIGYRNAKYKQKTVTHMEKGATLLFTDIITPGWSPDGDRFSYNMLQLKNEIYLDGELVVYDHIKLNPENQNIEALGYMEGYSHLGSMIVVGEQTTPEFIDKMYQMMDESEGDFEVGISQLPVSGFTLRLFANRTQTIEKIFADCQGMISREWFNKEASFLRKY